MEAAAGEHSDVAPVQALSPRSPPACVDLYGRRRQMARVQTLERQIGFLEEELKSVEGLQPASVYCEEIVDFVVATADPFIPTKVPKSKRPCGAWKWIRKSCGLNICFGCPSLTPSGCKPNCSKWLHCWPWRKSSCHKFNCGCLPRSRCVCRCYSCSLPRCSSVCRYGCLGC